MERGADLVRQAVTDPQETVRKGQAGQRRTVVDGLPTGQAPRTVRRDEVLHQQLQGSQRMAFRKFVRHDRYVRFRRVRDGIDARKGDQALWQLFAKTRIDDGNVYWYFCWGDKSMMKEWDLIRFHDSKKFHFVRTKEKERQNGKDQSVTTHHSIATKTDAKRPSFLSLFMTLVSISTIQ